MKHCTKLGAASRSPEEEDDLGPRGSSPRRPRRSRSVLRR